MSREMTSENVSGSRSPLGEETGRVPVSIPTRRLPGSEDLPYPTRMTPGAAGADLCAAVVHDTAVRAGGVAVIPTGLCLAIPPGFEGQVRPRSGLALRHGITVVNSPGTIDSDYRGEIKVLLTRLTSGQLIIKRGDRIAQLVIAPIADAVYTPVEHLGETRRGSGGFGHSGRSLELDSAGETPSAS